MKFNLISNIDNGYGLQRDYEILKGLLESAGHVVNGVQFQRPGNVISADVNIYLETVIDLHGYARENWYFPNPEWFELGRDGRHLPHLKYVLCKTQDAFGIFKQITDRARFVGFESLDLHCPEIEKKPRFLHVAGKSIVKNTEAIIWAWGQYKIQYKLTLIGTRYGTRSDTEFIHTIYRIPDDEEYARVMNSHMFHLCPSQYEGWGHCLHEGMSTGAVIITTDAPPMNEHGFPAERLVPVASRDRLRLAHLNKVDPEGIALAVGSVVSADLESINREKSANRDKFLSERDSFRAAFLNIVEKANGRLAA